MLMDYVKTVAWDCDLVFPVKMLLPNNVIRSLTIKNKLDNHAIINIYISFILEFIILVNKNKQTDKNLQYIW